MATEVRQTSETEDIETDCNALFEKYTIDGIRTLEKKTRANIEKKKEDLRVMVGERYRDLIDAADTITDMKNSAENVMKSISKMEDMCKQLKQTVMIKGASFHHTTAKPATLNRKKQEEEFYGVAAQIKLLLDMPEKMWSAVDGCDYLTATQLYLLARHINTALHLSAQRASAILSWFPVLTRQWAAISHFKTTILQGCRTLLTDTEKHLGDQRMAEYLCSIMLLEDTTPRQVFNEFLLARTKAIQQVLHVGVQQGDIKEQVCTMTSLLTATVHQIHAVFYNPPSPQEGCNLLLKTLEHVTSHSHYELGLLDLQGPISAKYLPKSVKDFKPALRNSVSSISVQNVQDNCAQWINTCSQEIKRGVGKLLGYINSGKRLADIRDTVWELLSQDASMAQWDEVCERVVNRKLQVWTDILQPLFLERVKALIQFQLDSTTEMTRRNVSRVMMELSSDVKNSSLQTEVDLATFLWTESPGDIPSNCVWTPASARSLSDGGCLMLKARALSPAVQSLCSFMDGKLAELLEDNSTYLCPDSVERTEDAPVGPFDCYSETGAILAFIQTSSTKCLQDVLDYLNEQLKLWEKSLTDIPDPATSAITENKILLVGRLCSAIQVLTPHLQRCILGNAEKPKQESARPGKKAPAQAVHPAWKAVVDKLTQCKTEAFRIWVDYTSKTMMEEFRSAIIADSWESRISNCSRWEEVDIEEETDEGKKLSSKIYVPCQPSWYVESLLYKLCHKLNCIGGQALPRSVIHSLIEQVTNKALEAYQQLVQQGKQHKRDKSGLPLTQQQALQSAFDLKFLLQTVPRKDEAEASRQYQLKAASLVDSLEESVDPFDLDVFAPYIQANLLKLLQRTAVLFGALTSLEKQTLLTSGRAPLSSQQEQHNVLPLSSCVLRFPLLPLSSQQSRSLLTQPLLTQSITRSLDAGSSSLTAAVEATLPGSVSQSELSSSLYDKLGIMGSRFFSNIGGKS